MKIADMFREFCREASWLICNKPMASMLAVGLAFIIAAVIMFLQEIGLL